MSSKNIKKTKKSKSNKKLKKEIIKYDDNDNIIQIGNLKLFEHQIEWANRALNILESKKSKVIVDQSPARRGKSFVQMFLAKALNLPVLIICPATIIVQWKRILREHNVKYVDVISYDSLTGIVGHPLKNPFLTKEDTYTLRGVVKHYYVTDFFKQLVDRGLLLIYDEADYGKNTGNRNKALRTLSKYIMSTENNSCISAVTATLMLKEDLTINILKILGIITEDKLYIVKKIDDEKIIEYKGLQQLVDKCLEYDEEETINVIYDNSLEPSNTKNIAFLLVTKVLFKHISGVMPEPVNRNPNLIYDVKNGFFNGINNEEIKKAVTNFMKAVNYSPEKDDTIDINNLSPDDSILFIDEFTRQSIELNKKNKLALQKKYHMQLEKAKLSTFIDVTSRILKLHKTSKVILALNYRDSIETIYNAPELEDYGIIYVNGDIKPENRSDYFNLFRFDKNYRIMLLSIELSHGYSLAMLEKNIPVYMFISPTYDFTKILQIKERPEDTRRKSNVYVRLFYIKNNYERNIIRALTRKHMVLQKLMPNDEVTSMTKQIKDVMEDDDVIFK